MILRKEFSMRASTGRNGFRYRRVMTALFCLLPLLLLAGCPYKSRAPLGPAADAKIDGGLLGRWKYEDKERKETGFLTISRFNDREMLISVDGDAGKAPDMMRGFVTAVDGENFLNLQEIEGAYGDRRWMFVRYTTGDCSLTFRVVNDLLAPAGGDKGLTPGPPLELVRKNLGNKKIYDEPTTLTCVRK
jgi:hypothetical protein